jgi:hypothetical protein
MKMLSEAFISLCDLVEAEGRLLKHKALQTIGVAMLMLLALLLFFVTLVLIMLAMYHTLLLSWSEPVAYLGTAFLSLFFTGGVLWLAMYLNKKP